MLEEILMIHFNCPDPLDDDENLTEDGNRAYNELIKLIYALGMMGVLNANSVITLLDAIVTGPV